MADTAQSTDETTPENAPATPTPTPPKRGLGHRGADPRDTAAELAARAHAISLEAGSRMSGAMRGLIHAAAGLGDFSIDTARDLVNFMVRRGQMAQDEADKLIREAEEAGGRPASARPAADPASSDVRSSENVDGSAGMPATTATPSQTVAVSSGVPAPSTSLATEDVATPAPSVANAVVPPVRETRPTPPRAKPAGAGRAVSKSAPKTVAKAPAGKTPASRSPAKPAAKGGKGAVTAKAPARGAAVKSPAKAAAKPAAKSSQRSAGKTAAKAPTRAATKAAKKGSAKRR